MSANSTTLGVVASSSTKTPKPLYETEYQELMQLKNTLINIQTAPEDFRKRMALIENGSAAHASLAMGSNLDLEAAAIKNADPTEIDSMIKRQYEQFQKLKLAYLEHETKDMFVRALVEDSPLVGSKDLQKVEEANVEKKKQLKALKKACAQMEKETEKCAREVVEEHARMKNEAKEIIDLITELRTMEQKVEALEAERQQKQRELEGSPEIYKMADSDPELKLSYEDMRRLAASYTQQASDLEKVAHAPLMTDAEKKDQVLQDTVRKVSELRQQRIQADNMARESSVARERNLARGLGKKEVTAQWHLNMLTVLEYALGVSDFTVEPVAQNQAPLLQNSEPGKKQKLWELSYVVAGASVKVIIREDTNQVVSATLNDPQNRVTSVAVERLVSESHDAEPSWFLIRLFSLLQ